MKNPVTSKKKKTWKTCRNTLEPRPQRRNVGSLTAHRFFFFLRMAREQEGTGLTRRPLFVPLGFSLFLGTGWPVESVSFFLFCQKCRRANVFDASMSSFSCVDVLMPPRRPFSHASMFLMPRRPFFSHASMFLMPRRPFSHASMFLMPRRPFSFMRRCF